MAEKQKKIRRLRGRQRTQGLAFNGLMLKVYCCIWTLCFSVAEIVLQGGLLQGYGADSSELASLLAEQPELIAVAAAESLLQILGGLCVPGYAFLLVEGFLHTSDFKKYLIRLFVTACVSEIPYDLAMRGNFLDFERQNVFFTLAVGLIMLKGLEHFEGGEGILYRVDQVIVAAAALLWSGLIFNSDYGLCVLLLAAVYYLLRERRLAKILVGCVVSLLYVSAPVTGFFLYCYNGERGQVKNKYLFYALFPLHLLVLFALQQYFLR